MIYTAILYIMCYYVRFLQIRSYIRRKCTGFPYVHVINYAYHSKDNGIDYSAAHTWPECNLKNRIGTCVAIADGQLC